MYFFKDGTTEKDIPSTELHPIHHLDDLEFFPGDFVIPSDGNWKVVYVSSKIVC